MIPMESYPYTVQTIQAKYPLLPAVLAGIDLNREVIAHTVLNREDARCGASTSRTSK